MGSGGLIRMMIIPFHSPSDQIKSGSYLKLRCQIGPSCGNIEDSVKCSLCLFKFVAQVEGRNERREQK